MATGRLAAERSEGGRAYVPSEGVQRAQACLFRLSVPGVTGLAGGGDLLRGNAIRSVWTGVRNGTNTAVIVLLVEKERETALFNYCIYTLSLLLC